MIAEEIYLETLGTQFDYLAAEIEQLKSQMDRLPDKALPLNSLLNEKVRLETALKNLSLAPLADQERIKVQIAREFDLLQEELTHLKEVVVAATEISAPLAERHIDSIGWAEGQAADNPVDSIGCAEGQADDNPVDSIGWAEGQADDNPVDSIGWAEGYKHE